MEGPPEKCRRLDSDDYLQCEDFVAASSFIPHNSKSVQEYITNTILGFLLNYKHLWTTVPEGELELEARLGTFFVGSKRYPHSLVYSNPRDRPEGMRFVPGTNNALFLCDFL